MYHAALQLKPLADKTITKLINSWKAYVVYKYITFSFIDIFTREEVGERKW